MDACKKQVVIVCVIYYKAVEEEALLQYQASTPWGHSRTKFFSVLHRSSINHLVK